MTEPRHIRECVDEWLDTVDDKPADLKARRLAAQSANEDRYGDPA